MVWAEKQWLFSEDSYLTRKSQFWCVIKGVSTRFYGDEWYRYVAWSNICKAAPKSRGNPRDPLFYRTLENNIKIFRTELDFWSPKYIVLLTEGIRRDYKTEIYWASDFISSLNNGNIPPVFYEIAWDDEYPSIKTEVYKLGERYIILSLHPQVRKTDPHTDAIIDTIERIEQQK